VAPEHAAPPTHATAPAHVVVPAHVSAPSHAHIQPADAAGPRWFTRGLGGERPRISVVGTLSLSVLISAGLFAAQRIFNPPQKHHDDTVAVDSSAALRLAAHTPDDADDDSAAPASVSSHAGHVHAPAAHGHSHSARAVASDDQSSDDSLVSDATDSASATKSHHHASRAVQPATDESDSLPADLDGTAQTANHSTHAPLDPMSSLPGNASPVASQIAQPQAPLQSSLPINQSAALPSYPAGLPATPAGGQSVDLSNPQWPATQAGAGPAPTSTVQVSAEAANTPTLTIVPGRPENFAIPGGQRAPVMQPIAQAPPVAPQPVAPQQVVPQQVAPQYVPAPAPPITVQPIATQPTASPIQPTAQQVPADAPGSHYSELPAAAPGQPAANPLTSLDHTKVMSFQFRNAPWSLVLAKFASATGLELRMQAMPDGTFNRWDSARYTPTQTLAILNSELAKLGCQAKIIGTSLYVVQAGAADAATAGPAVVPASASMPASAPMPQYASAPGTATR
jgi:hypothetical protein